MTENDPSAAGIGEDATETDQSVTVTDTDEAFAEEAAPCPRTPRRARRTGSGGRTS